MLKPVLIAVLGIAMRLYVGSLGYTQDLVYEAKHVEFYQHGGFSEVMNWSLIHYGPVQPLLILLLDKLPFSLATSMTLCNAAVDLWIAWMLWRWVGGVAATLFWLCPVTVIVGGYQRVPETLALGLGLAAVLVLESEEVHDGGGTLGRQASPTGRRRSLGSWTSAPPVARTLVAALLLGLSLATKYDLVLLPVWLCLRRDA